MGNPTAINGDYKSKSPNRIAIALPDPKQILIKITNPNLQSPYLYIIKIIYLIRPWMVIR